MDITVQEGYFFTKEHEWVKVDGSKAKIGISDYAQQKLGDITYVEPVDSGVELKQGDVLTGIESVKAASDIYSPLSGKITAFNNALEDAPELVNQSPYGDGWIVEIEIASEDETGSLMDAASYKKYAEAPE
jgi:glycine cleavage system H protein